MNSKGRTTPRETRSSRGDASKASKSGSPGSRPNKLSTSSTSSVSSIGSPSGRTAGTRVSSRNSTSSSKGGSSAERKSSGTGSQVPTKSPSTPNVKSNVASPNSPIASASPKAPRIKSMNQRRDKAAEPSGKEDDGKTEKVMFSPAVYRKDDDRQDGSHSSSSYVPPNPPPQPEEDEQYEEGDLDEEEFDPFLFIKHLPPIPQHHLARKKCLLPKSPKAPRISLALDLDETLVHCSVEPLSKAELTFSVNFNGVDYQVYVRTRPHLRTFLKQVSQWFEVIVFTASQKVYADKLLNILDPNNEFIQHRVFRDSCVCINGNYLKDLHILGRDLKTTAIVDNSVQAFGYQINNGIPIESWFDDENDSELLSLLSFLKNLKDVKDDVRPLIKSTFKLEEFVQSL